MLYYSMQVIWPRQASLLFVPANEPILRGVYANLTLFGTWGESHYSPVRTFLCESSDLKDSISDLRLGCLCQIRA